MRKNLKDKNKLSEIVWAKRRDCLIKPIEITENGLKIYSCEDTVIPYQETVEVYIGKVVIKTRESMGLIIESVVEGAVLENKYRVLPSHKKFNLIIKLTNVRKEEGIEIKEGVCIVNGIILNNVSFKIIEVSNRVLSKYHYG